jgi:hypothetical protein
MKNMYKVIIVTKQLSSFNTAIHFGRSQLDRPGAHFIAGFGKQSGIGCADVKHLHPFRLYSHLFKDLFGLVNAFFSSQISFQEMAIAFLSAGGKNRTVLEGFQQMQGVQLARTHQLDNTHIRRILQPHGTGQVGG